MGKDNFEFVEAGTESSEPVIVSDAVYDPHINAVYARRYLDTKYIAVGHYLLDRYGALKLVANIVAALKAMEAEEMDDGH